LRVTHADAATFERDLETLLQFWEIKWAPSYSKGSLARRLQDHRVILRACFRDGGALLAVLWQGDTPIGAQGTLIDRRNRSLLCLAGSRDLAVKKPSPSFVLHLHCIRWAIRNGFTTYDLQQGNHGYKYDFGPEERHLDTQVIMTADLRNLRGTLEPRSLPVAFAQVQALHRAGRAAWAAAGCRQILAADSRHAGARQFLRQIEVSPTVPPTDFDRARDLARRGRLAEAALILRTVLASEPNSFDARRLFALVLLQQGRAAVAERQFRLAIALAPNRPPVHVDHGRALAALGRPAEALASYDRAIALDPGDQRAHSGRADALKALGRFDEALKSYDRAVALNAAAPKSTRGGEPPRAAL
jgi:Flp pilus assembly protein TadD